MIHLLRVALIATMMFINPITAAMLLLSYLVGFAIWEMTAEDIAQAERSDADHR